MDTLEKLKILADSAKYDASCSSSGSNRKNKNNGIGNGNVYGICHTWGADRKMYFTTKNIIKQFMHI